MHNVELSPEYRRIPGSLPPVRPIPKPPLPPGGRGLVRFVKVGNATLVDLIGAAITWQRAPQHRCAHPRLGLNDETAVPDAAGMSTSTDSIPLVVSWFPTAMPTGPAIGDLELMTWGRSWRVLVAPAGERNGPCFAAATFIWNQTAATSGG